MTYNVLEALEINIYVHTYILKNPILEHMELLVCLSYFSFSYHERVAMDSFYR
jgi:hypothetical protein